MHLDCYKIYDVAPQMVPARSNRDWMDAFTDRHPYRCLPLTMAMVFDEEPGNPTIGDCRGWIAYQMFGGGEFERVSEMTTWKHAEAVLGPLHASTYRGPNIPASYKGSAADLDLIMARLSSAGLAG